MTASQDIVESAKQTISSNHLLTVGERVIVAVSGGADSVALLHILLKLSSELNLTIAIAHIDHGLRPESGVEAEYVKTLAANHQLPFFFLRENLATEKTGIEEKARKIRYDFFKKMAIEFASSAIAVAHTADDQAETILQHLIKGSGILGLAGIPIKRPIVSGSFINIIRPLLEVTKKELIAYLQQENINWYEDASNQSLTFERNRVRHKLMPVLEEDFNSNIVSALIRTGKRAREISLYLQTQAQELFETAKLSLCPKKKHLQKFLSLCHPSICLFKSDTIANIPDALFAFFWLRALEPFYSQVPIREHHYQAIKELAVAPQGEIFLPNDIRIRKSGKETYIVGGNANSIIKQQIDIPGQISLFTDMLLQPRYIDFTKQQRQDIIDQSHDLQIAISLDNIELPLLLRSWNPGETMQPLGLRGTKKISKILSDLRLPLPLRSQIPLITDQKNQPVWLVGICVSDKVKITSETQQGAILTVDV